MGWSYRKSFGSGPFRINFSKSGISYSVGVKGTRVNIGSHGTYVNLSSYGVSYRKKIASPHHAVSPQSPLMEQTSLSAQTISSAGIDQLTDTDSFDFVTELNQKASQWSYVKWLGIAPFCLFLFILLFSSFDNKTVIIKPATDSVFVRVTSDIGVNIRSAANARSAIITNASYGKTFPLLDSTNTKWLTINLPGGTGFISRRFSTINNLHYDEETEVKSFLSNPYFGLLLMLGSACFIILIFRLRKIDRRRYEMALHYDMDEQFQQIYRQFSTHFIIFTRSARVWQYITTQHVSDYKRNAGAGKLIKRLPIREISINKAPLPYFVTNVTIPSIKLNHIQLYFLPERLLIKRDRKFAAVFYKNLRIDGTTARFIEDGSVPPDAQIVDHNWRFVNKSGGPDRRFSNNRKIPICAYSQYTLRSDTGVNEIITTSKNGAMDNFAGIIMKIGQLQSRAVIR